MSLFYQPFPMAGRARGQIWRYAPEFRRPRHFHAEPELNVVVRGTATFGAGEMSQVVSSGDLLWWLPGQDHELVEASPDFDLFVIGLTPELSDRVLGGASPSAFAGPARVRLAGAALDRLRERCLGLPAPGDTAAVEGHVGDVWRDAHALRAAPPAKHALTRRALASLLDRRDVGRGDIAVRARAAPSEVSRHFRRDLGLTLTAYRTRLRLLKLIENAQDGTQSLLSAALLAGFGSYSQCHRAFRQTLACTPRTFFSHGLRAQMREVFAPAALLDTAAASPRPLTAASRTP